MQDKRNLYLSLGLVVLVVIFVTFLKAPTNSDNLGAAPCVKAAPTIEPYNGTLPVPYVVAGASENDGFVITNNDSPNCKAATFTFTTQPINWTASALCASAIANTAVMPYTSVATSFFQNSNGLLPLRIPASRQSEMWWWVKVPACTAPGTYPYSIVVSRQGNPYNPALDATFTNSVNVGGTPYSETTDLASITPTNLQVIAKTATAVALQWQTAMTGPSGPNPAGNVAEYRIYDGATLVATIPRKGGYDTRDMTMNPTYVVTGLVANSPHNFTVKAYTYNGVLLPNLVVSQSATTNVPADGTNPGVPVINSVVAGPSNWYADITWAATDNTFIKGFKLIDNDGGLERFCELMSSTSTFSASGHTVINTCRVNSLGPNSNGPTSTYNMKMVVYDIDGNSRSSANFNVVVPI